jgi:hypothetical protein
VILLVGNMQFLKTAQTFDSTCVDSDRDIKLLTTVLKSLPTVNRQHIPGVMEVHIINLTTI